MLFYVLHAVESIGQGCINTFSNSFYELRIGEIKGLLKIINRKTLLIPARNRKTVKQIIANASETMLQKYCNKQLVPAYNLEILESMEREKILLNYLNEICGLRINQPAHI